jgi:hypothetical protein
VRNGGRVPKISSSASIAKLPESAIGAKKFRAMRLAALTVQILRDADIYIDSLLGLEGRLLGKDHRCRRLGFDFAAERVEALWNQYFL